MTQENEAPEAVQWTEPPAEAITAVDWAEGERPSHESEDQGAIQTLQEWRDGAIVRFPAFCLGLGSPGSKGRFRSDRDQPWIAAGVDAIVNHPDGPIYCIYRLMAP